MRRFKPCHSAFPSIAAVLAVASAASLLPAPHAHAATTAVPPDGSLQAAIDAAQPGDVITLEPGATYIGNFVLPDKGPIDNYILIRSAAPDSALPPAGIRITPAYNVWLPKIKSPNYTQALRTAASANHWKLMFLEFQANQDGFGEIIALGAGDSTQSDLSQVPHHLVIDRVYVHGDPVVGQKRGIAVNSSDTSIINSYISDCKAVGQDSQAIQGHNGPGNYLIENNYLEGATENFLLGGSDPVIPNLVISDVLFRRNYLSKPLAWRNPIANPPGDVTAAVSSGLLPSGTYAYRVASRVPVSTSPPGGKAVSALSSEVVVTIDAGTGGAVVLTWSPVPGATDYVVYGRTPASENMHWTTAAPTFTDTGAPGTSETLSTGTRWSVKNLFELKNARDVVVEGNTMENVWVAGQSGYAIQLTPRNQNGHAPWSTVERVSIHDNLLRHMAGGVNILGHDSPNPSQQANHITVSHNLFDDLTQATWGTGSRPFQVGDGPDSIRIDHNTIITTDATILYFHGGPAASPTHVTGMEYTNNMSPHNTYGINGSNFSPGLSAIHAYIPDGVVIGNVLAGGTASRYPAGNLFPSPTEWQGEFMDYAGGDYRLRPDSRYKGAGTDGTDLGSNIEIVMAHAKGAAAGDVTDSPSPCPPRLEVITTALADGTVMEPYEKRLLACGSAATTGWSLLSGALPDGISLDEAGRIAGVPTAAGTFAFTVQVSDTYVPPRTASQPLSLTIALAPVVIVTETLPSGVAGAAYSTMLLATGGSGSYVWSIVDGAMPDGLTLTGAGAISGTPTTPGTFTVTVQATDAGFSQNIATHSFSIDVAPPFTISIPPPPAGTFSRPYQLRATASGQIGVVTWSIVSGALPPVITLDASTGVMAGSPTAVSTFTALVRGQDSGYVTRTADASVTIVIKRLRCQAATPHHIPPCWPHR